MSLRVAAPPGGPVLARHVAGVVALVLVTLGLRLHGLDYALPHMIEQDTEIVSQVEHLRDGRDDAWVRRDFSAYPLGVAWMTCAWSRTPPELASSEDGTREDHLAAAGATFLDLRTTVAVFSILTIPAAFLLARSFVAPGWSLFASALVAFSVLAETMAQQARPHGVLAVFVAWTLVAATRLNARPLRYALVGAAFFGAMGTLHNGLALGLPIVAAHLLRPDRKGLQLGRFALALVPGLLAIPVFYPFLADESTTGIEEEGVTFGTHEVAAEVFSGGGAPAILRTLWSYEPLLAALLVAALLAWLLTAARRRELPGFAALVLLAFALPYLAVLVVYSDTRDRFVLPLLPCLAAFAAWGASTVVTASVVRASRGLATGLTVAALALPAFTTWRLASLRAQPDTLSEAAAWIVANAEPSEPIYLSPRPLWMFQSSSIDLPLGRTAEALIGPGGFQRADYNIWTRYQRRLADRRGPPPRFPIRWVYWRRTDVEDYRGPPARYFAEHPRGYFASMGPGLYVVEVFEGRPASEFEGLRAALQQFGERVARFAPDADPEYTTLPLHYRDWKFPRPHMTRRLLQARAWGPYVEIYRLTAADLAE